MDNYKTVAKLLVNFSGQARNIGCPVEHIDFMGGDISGGVFLNQIIYWSDRGDGDWFWKTKESWWEESRLTEYKERKYRKVCKKLGFLETKRKKNKSGTPVLFYKFDLVAYTNLVIERMESKEPNLGNQRIESGKSKNLIGNILNEKQKTRELSKDESSLQTDGLRDGSEKTSKEKESGEVNNNPPHPNQPPAEVESQPPTNQPRKKRKKGPDQIITNEIIPYLSTLLDHSVRGGSSKGTQWGNPIKIVYGRIQKCALHHSTDKEPLTPPKNKQFVYNRLLVRATKGAFRRAKEMMDEEGLTYSDANSLLFAIEGDEGILRQDIFPKIQQMADEGILDREIANGFKETEHE